MQPTLFQSVLCCGDTTSGTSPPSTPFPSRHDAAVAAAAAADDDSNNNENSRDKAIAAETAKCGTMSVRELRRELTSRGIVSESFIEKSEFARALAEALVDGATTINNNPSVAEREQRRPREEEEEYNHPVSTEKDEAITRTSSTTNYTAAEERGFDSTTTTSNSPQSDDPFASSSSAFAAAAPLCTAPCAVGNCPRAEMIVDTGAQVSVLSLLLARRLGLDHAIDESFRGTASGVGSARIVGKLLNVPIGIGPPGAEVVEFAVDFSVLDVPESELLLLGLDTMRKYRCVVDLDEQVLVFGGRDGVAVDLSPPTDERLLAALRNEFLNDGGCPTM